MNTPSEDLSPSLDKPTNGVGYEITYSDEHVMTLWRRLRQSKRRSRMFMRVFRVVAGLVLAGLIVLVLVMGRWRYWHLAAALGAILGALVFSEHLDAWLVVRRWRRSLGRNSRATIAFTSDGFSGHSDLGQSTSKWAAFTAALRFPDGFLLFSGPYLPRWYPDAALVRGTPDDAAALFKAYVPQYQQP